MSTPLSLSLLLASASLVLLPLANAGAQDVGLFSGSGGAKLNIMILLDPSGSMNHAPAGCTLPDGSKLFLSLPKLSRCVSHPPTDSVANRTPASISRG